MAQGTGSSNNSGCSDSSRTFVFGLPPKQQSYSSSWSASSTATTPTPGTSNDTAAAATTTSSNSMGQVSSGGGASSKVQFVFGLPPKQQSYSSSWSASSTATTPTPGTSNDTAAAATTTTSSQNREERRKDQGLSGLFSRKDWGSLTPAANNSLYDIYTACEVGNKCLVDKYLTLPGFDVNKANSNGQTALVIAIENNQTAIIDSLLAHPSIIINNPRSKNLLIHACENNDQTLLDKLLKCSRANINERTGLKDSCLMIAVRKNYENIVEKILQLPNIKVNDKNFANENALQIALFIALQPAEVKSKPMPQKFVPYQIPIVELNNEFEFKEALTGRCTHAIINQSLIATNHINYSAESQEALRLNYMYMTNEELNRGKIQTQERILDKLLSHPATDLNTVNAESSLKLLLNTCRMQNVYLLEKILAKSRAGVNIRDEVNDGIFALSIAASNGHLDVLNLLLAYGANVNLTTNEGDSCLMIATKNGHANIVDRLLKVPEIDVNNKNNADETALQIAIVGRKLDFADKLLSDASINVNIGSKNLLVVIIAAISDAKDSVARGGRMILQAPNRSNANPIVSKCTGTVSEFMDFLRKVLAKSSTLVNNQFKSKDSPTIRFAYYFQGRAPHITSVLSIAAAHGYLDVLNLLLEFGADVNLANDEGDSCLVIAVKYDYAYIVDRLLKESNIDVNAKSNANETALQIAINNRNLVSSMSDVTDVSMEVLCKLLSHPATDLNTVDAESSLKLLLNACQKRNVYLLEKILAKSRAGVNIRDEVNDGIFALSIAASNGHLDVLNLLLAYGANVNLTTNEGDSCLMIATKNGHANIVDRLLKCVDLDIKSRSKSNLSNFLFDACKKGDIQFVERILKFTDNLDINRHFRIFTLDCGISFENRYTALLVSCERGHYELCQLLLSKGASVNSVSLKGESALVLAAKSDRLDLVELFISKGADFFAQNDDFVSFLHIALSKAVTNKKYLPLLEKTSIDWPKIEAKLKGKSILFQVIESNDLDLLKFLFERGINLDMVDIRTRKTALFFCLELEEKCRHEFFAFFLSKGVFVDNIDSNGDSLLHICCELKAYDIAFMTISSYESSHYLKELQRFINHQNMYRNACFHLGAAAGDLIICTNLLKYHANIELVNSKGETPLLAAAKSGRLDVIELLLENGAKTNTRDYGFNSILNIALETSFIKKFRETKETSWKSCFSQFIKRILECGADRDAIGENGMHPFSFAVQNNYSEVCEILIDHGVRPDFVIDLKSKETFLTTAIKFKRIDICKLLINKGANLNLLDASFKSYLNLSIENDLYDVVQALLEGKFDTDTFDESGMYPLSVAVNKGSYQCCKLLLDYGVDVNCINIKSRETPLHLELKLYNLDSMNYSQAALNICNLLIERGANFLVRDANLKSPLYLAIESCTRKSNNIKDMTCLIEKLLDRGAGSDPYLFDYNDDVDANPSVFDLLIKLRDPRHKRIIEMVYYAGLHLSKKNFQFNKSFVERNYDSISSFKLS